MINFQGRNFLPLRASGAHLVKVAALAGAAPVDPRLDTPVSKLAGAGSEHRIFGAISKIREDPDGSVYVEGVASSEVRDAQGEIVLASAMRAAIPGFLRADGTGPVREMHALKAAGKTTAVEVGDDGKTYVSVKVVDAEAARKVREGVYQGFSIGGHVPPGGRNKTDPKIIEALTWSELSLVDRGANPEAVFTLVKIH